MKYKVLLVSPFPPPYGGIGRYVQDLLNSQLKNNFQLIAFDTSKYDHLRNTKYESDMRNFRRIFKIQNLKFTLASIYTIFEYIIILIRQRPHITHIHTCSYWGFIRSGIFCFFSRLFAIKTILHLHNAIDSFYFQEIKSKFGKMIIRIILNVPDLNITLSVGIREMLQPIVKKQIRPVYNAVRTEIFSKRYFYKNQKIQFLYAGAVVPEKGVWDIINALGKLDRADLNRISMTFIGRGEIAKGKILALKNGLENIVKFTGMISEEEKNRYFIRSDVFVLSSYREGQPISIIEAMASGMPIIATTVGSIPEIIKDEMNGFLIKPGDIDALTESMRRIIREKKLRNRMSRNNYALARKKFDISRVFFQIDGLYSMMLMKENR